MRNTKSKKTFDWNKLSIIISLCVLVISIITTYNQKQINILSVEVQKLERENISLKNESDPNWQEKYNTQRQFFENEILDREKEIRTLKDKLIIKILKTLK